MTDTDEKAAVIDAATDVLDYAQDRTADLTEPSAACAFVLAVATVSASAGNLTRDEFIALMSDVWDRVEAPEPSTLN